MKKFDTEKSDLSGFLGTKNLISNSEQFMELSNILDDKLLYKLFKDINKNENELLPEYISEYENVVYQNCYNTNLYEMNIDIQKVTDKNLEFGLRKNSLIAYYLLTMRKTSKREENLKITGLEKINTYLDNENKGFTLAFYHWGLFQNLIPIILTIFKRPIVLYASKESVDYQKRLIDLYMPEFTEQLIPLPVDFTSINKCISFINQGYIVCILPELNGLNSTKQTSIQTFLGENIVMPLGTATLSAYSETPIFRAFLEEESEGKLWIDFDLITNNVKKNRTSIEDATKLIWDDLEILCYKNPEKWFGWEILERIKCK